MRIGFDAKRYYHNSTGLGNYARNLIEGLRQYAPEIELRLYDCKGFERSFSMARLAVQDGCDIFHGLSNSLPFDIGSRAVKSIVTVHDLCWRTFPSMYHTSDILIHDLKCHFAVKHADCIIAISESTKNDIVHHYGIDPEKIKVIYQSVDSMYFEPIDKTAARTQLSECLPQLGGSAIPQLAHDYILCVGSINARKNQLNAMKALAALSPENRPQLVICGKGDKKYTALCRDYANRNLRPADVLWIDNADNRTLKLLYGAALAMLYPSFYEGFGLPVVEALLQRTPVITSTLSSLPEAAGPGALLVNPSDVGAISDALAHLLDDSSLRLSLATQGYDYCLTHFNPQTATANYIRKIRESLA